MQNKTRLRKQLGTVKSQTFHAVLFKENSNRAQLELTSVMSVKEAEKHPRLT